ncbi:MAG TPA: hypothetical protein VD905_06760, partial [Flavobacteriales bacterium]|nr:hypothetical protein [Flavobacteriales bacterium]
MIPLLVIGALALIASSQAKATKNKLVEAIIQLNPALEAKRAELMAKDMKTLKVVLTQMQIKPPDTTDEKPPELFSPGDKMYADGKVKLVTTSFKPYREATAGE